MKKNVLVLLLLFTVSFTATAYCVELDDEEVVNKSFKNVILFIGDGMGATQVAVTESYLSYKALSSLVDVIAAPNPVASTVNSCSFGYSLRATYWIVPSSFVIFSPMTGAVGYTLLK